MPKGRILNRSPLDSDTKRMRRADAAGFRSLQATRRARLVSLVAAIGGAAVATAACLATAPSAAIAAAVLGACLWALRREHRQLARVIDDGAMYRRLVEGIPVVIYVDSADDVGSAMFISPQIEEITGYTEAEWFSYPDFFVDVLHPDDRDRLQREIAFNNAGNRNRSEYRVIAKDGRIVWFYDESTPERDEAGRVVCTRGCMIDISDRKRAEEELAAAEGRYRALIEQLPVTLYIDRPDLLGSAQYVSPQIESLVGYSASEFARDGELYLSIVHPDDVGAVERQIELASRGERSSLEYRLISRDGRTVWVLDDAVPELAADGTVTSIRGFIIDVTELREAGEALARKEEELRQAQKMEAIGRIAGGVAHDFNNLLTVIGGNISLALLDEELGGQIRGDLEEVSAAAARAAGLTRQLLAFSRRQVLQPAVLHLSDVVLDMEGILRRSAGESLTFEVDARPGIGRVLADRTQVEQVLLNLVVNARDATPDGGRVVVEVDVSPDGGSAILSVTDSGSGVPPEVLDRIFDPFFTTKAPGVGTGLGLSTVLGVVEQSGGAIEVADVPGGGTRFVVTLPTVTEEPEVGPAWVAPPRGSGTILVVEDEAGVRSLVERSLRAAGYDVVTAADSAEAVAMADLHAARIDLLLTDVVLAGDSGRLVAEAVTARIPGLPFLYMSGYTDDEIVRRGVSLADALLLEKPFTPAQLCAKVGEALESVRRVTDRAGSGSGAQPTVNSTADSTAGSSGM